MPPPIFHIPNPVQVPRVEQSSPEPWQGIREYSSTQASIHHSTGQSR